MITFFNLGKDMIVQIDETVWLTKTQQTQIIEQKGFWCDITAF